MKWNGKMKALTFSFDDAVTQDKKFIELLNKYGMKCTFNLNSGLLGQSGQVHIGDAGINHIKVTAADVRAIYEGHEIAAHTIDHPLLPGIESDDEIVRQVEEDRLRLSELADYEVVGFAYPCGGMNFNDRVAKLIKERTGVKYARNIISSFSFEKQPDLYKFKPTVHQHANPNEMFALGEKFIEMKPDKPQIYYVWGHSYEFDFTESWDKLEEFLKLISGKDDIFYGTNAEVLLKNN